MMNRLPAATLGKARDIRLFSSVPTIPPLEFTPEPHKGLSYERLQQIRKDHLTPTLLTYYKNPVYLNQGYKQWLFDVEGRRYLDFFAGIVTVGIGHCHPKVVEAATKQMNLLWHSTNIYYNHPMHEYAEKLVAKMPGNLKVCYFVNSGSEANDLAFMMARLHTGAYDIISLRNGYHGTSPYLLGALSLGNWKHQFPTSFGIHPAMNPDPYRGEWGGRNCRDSPVQPDRDCSCAEGQCLASEKYAEQVKEILKYQVPKKVAGFIAESIQGVGGTMQFPRGYLKRVFELVRERGGVCISDEVQTGFGRTGSHFWGFENHDVIPDIVTLAKSIANGFPMAAVVTTPEIARSIASATHFNTFGGNPIGCSVASAVLDVIDEEGLMENCAKVGTYMLEQMATLRKYPIVGDVRGKGLMTGIEFVEDKATRVPLPLPLMNDIWERTKDMGLLVGKSGLHGTVFRLKPPMCITKQDVDFAVAVIHKAIQDHMAAQVSH